MDGSHGLKLSDVVSELLFLGEEVAERSLTLEEFLLSFGGFGLGRVLGAVSGGVGSLQELSEVFQLDLLDDDGAVDLLVL